MGCVQWLLSKEYSVKTRKIQEPCWGKIWPMWPEPGDWDEHHQRWDRLAVCPLDMMCTFLCISAFKKPQSNYEKKRQTNINRKTVYTCLTNTLQKCQKSPKINSVWETVTVKSSLRRYSHMGSWNRLKPLGKEQWHLNKLWTFLIILCLINYNKCTITTERC